MLCVLIGKVNRTITMGKGEEKYNYIFGNPPFIGHHLQTKEQKEDLHFVLHDIDAAGVMDYVSAWYYKAANYMQEHSSCHAELVSASFPCTKIAFVSSANNKNTRRTR